MPRRSIPLPQQVLSISNHPLPLLSRCLQIFELNLVLNLGCRGRLDQYRGFFSWNTSLRVERGSIDGALVASTLRRVFGSLRSTRGSVLGRHNILVTVQGLASGGIGGNLSISPHGASHSSPRATIPDIADDAIADVKVLCESVTKVRGRDEGLILFGSGGSQREDLQDLRGREPGISPRRFV